MSFPHCLPSVQENKIYLIPSASVYHIGSRVSCFFFASFGLYPDFSLIHHICETETQPKQIDNLRADTMKFHKIFTKISYFASDFDPDFTQDTV